MHGLSGVVPPYIYTSSPFNPAAPVRMNLSYLASCTTLAALIQDRLTSRNHVDWLNPSTKSRYDLFFELFQFWKTNLALIDWQCIIWNIKFIEFIWEIMAILYLLISIKPNKSTKRQDSINGSNNQQHPDHVSETPSAEAMNLRTPYRTRSG